MVFSSLPFLFFIFPLFILAIFCSSFFKSAKLRNILIILLSLLFYIWEESRNVLILITICLINYYGALYLNNEKHGKKIFIGLICVNLLTLFTFKYSLWCLSFVTDRFIDKNIMILGISFFICSPIWWQVLLFAMHKLKRIFIPITAQKNFFPLACIDFCWD